MFDFLKKKDKECIKKQQECVVRIESDDDAFYKRRIVLRGSKNIGAIVYSDNFWNFECALNRESYPYYVSENLSELELTLILEEIKRLNAINL